MGKALGRSLALVGAMLALMLTGCGDGGNESPHRGLTAKDEAAAYGVDENGLAFTGADSCVGCHTDVDDPSTTKVEGCRSCHSGATWAGNWETWGAMVREKYLESGHVLHSDRIDASAANAGCNGLCHDPVGDGRGLEGWVDEAAVPAKGLAAVTCEACHGAGGDHRGSNPMPNPSPGYAVCGGCHNETMPSIHDKEFPEGLKIREQYVASRHARTVAIDPADPDYARCLQCHTDEGAKSAAASGVASAPATPSQVQCRTCHDSHKPAELLGMGAAVAAAGSPEFKTCTFCHELANPYDHTTVLAALSTPPKAEQVTLTDTHVAQANSWETTYIVTNNVVIGTTKGNGTNTVDWNFHKGNSTNDIAVTGYAMNSNDARVCRNCHNPHQANVAEDAAAAAADPAASKQFYEWASSRHANRTGIGAWAHYDWSQTSRQSCQRCHTTSGAKAYLTALETGRPYTPPLSSTVKNAFKPEMLQCSGCHSSNVGDLRKPGPITADYSITISGKTTTITETYPDVAGSNICVSCHDGRASGRTIEAIGTGTPSFQNSHYLGAAGTLFQKLGYDFGDRVITTYSEPKLTMHQLVGTPSVPVEGAEGNLQGPCATCHMTGEETHRFLPVEHDEDGKVVALRPGVICSACHSETDDSLVGGRMNAETLEAEREEFRAALAWLEVLLAQRGFYFAAESPYFFKVDHTTLMGLLDAAPTFADFSLVTSQNRVASWPSLDAVGAAFNFNYLEHEPGAYVHGKAYVKQLLQWSIDWAYNGAVDNDFSAALASIPATAPYDGALKDEYNAAKAKAYFNP